MGEKSKLGVAHSSSGRGHRPLKADEQSDSIHPPFVGAAQALVEYLTHMENRGMSESHISKSAEYLGRYCEAIANMFANISAESAETFLSKSNHTKPNTRAKYITYLKAFLNYCSRVPYSYCRSHCSLGSDAYELIVICSRS